MSAAQQTMQFIACEPNHRCLVTSNDFGKRKICSIANCCRGALYSSTTSLSESERKEYDTIVAKHSDIMMQFTAVESQLESVSSPQLQTNMPLKRCGHLQIRTQNKRYFCNDANCLFSIFVGSTAGMTVEAIQERNKLHSLIDNLFLQLKEIEPELSAISVKRVELFKSMNKQQETTSDDSDLDEITKLIMDCGGRGGNRSRSRGRGNHGRGGEYKGRGGEHKGRGIDGNWRGRSTAENNYQVYHSNDNNFGRGRGRDRGNNNQPVVVVIRSSK